MSRWFSSCCYDQNKVHRRGWWRKGGGGYVVQVPRIKYSIYDPMYRAFNPTFFFTEKLLFTDKMQSSFTFYEKWFMIQNTTRFYVNTFKIMKKCPHWTKIVPNYHNHFGDISPLINSEHTHYSIKYLELLKCKTHHLSKLSNL